MIRDVLLKERWERLVDQLTRDFSDGEQIELEGIIYLIGVQELGKISQSKFQKDEKINLMHIAICRLLENYGYYEFDGIDEDGWPHYRVVQNLPVLKAGEQSILIKEAIVAYFLENKYID